MSLTDIYNRMWTESGEGAQSLKDMKNQIHQEGISEATPRAIEQYRSSGMQQTPIQYQDYDFPQAVMDGQSLTPSDTGLNIDNKYENAGKTLVAGKDLGDGKNYGKPLEDRYGLAGPAFNKLQGSHVNTMTGRPATDADPLSYLALENLAEGKNLDNYFGMIADSWPEDVKRQGVSAAVNVKDSLDYSEYVQSCQTRSLG